MRLHRRFVTWLALLTVAFGALAPAAAQAFTAGAQRNALVEVCISTGMVLMDIAAADGSTAPADQADAGKHCPWCSLHSGVALPPQAYSVPLLPRAEGMPAAFYRAGPMPAAWRGVRSRAPPLV